MTTAEVMAILSQAATVACGFVVSVLLPAALRWARDQRNQAAFAAVTRAGKIGALAAAGEVQRQLVLAADPKSDGGSTVTPMEMRAALKAGVDAAKASLRAQVPALFDTIVKIYGGEAALDQALGTLVGTMVKDHAVMG